MKKILALIATIILAGVVTAAPLQALDAGQREQFDRYMQMSQPDLADAADKLLQGKYPDEDWSAHDLPDYAVRDEVTEVSYRIAVKKPELLGRANVSDSGKVIPCYCTCQEFGHQNLLYCFFRNGKPGDGFDDHGSMCSICIRQAFLAFVWSELGATHAEIIQGMEKQFAAIIEKQRRP